MRRVWLVALTLLVAGCPADDPGPPPADDASEPAPDGGNETAGGDEDGQPPDETNDTDDGGTPTMQIHSPAFSDGEPIPVEHSKREGENTSPPLNLTDVPDEAASLALIVDDPDAPRDEPFVHWLIWNVPPEADTIAEGYPPSGDGKAFHEARQGMNDFGNQRYDGPAPPEGEGAHRYRFQLFALDRQLDVEEGAQRAELENAMGGAVVAEDTLTGTYER